MRHTSAVLAAAALALALGGCKPRPIQQKLPEVTDVFSTVVLPPSGSLVSREGGPDALQLTFTSPAPVDSVTGYYRGVFSRDPFVLVSDTKEKDNTVALYVEEAHRPMWLRIRPKQDGSGTWIELSGAVTKKAGRDSTRSSSAAAKVATPTAPTPAAPKRDSAAKR
jgi:hypothetical protein